LLVALTYAKVDFAQSTGHGFWAVTAPGTYRINFKATGTLVPSAGRPHQELRHVEFTFKVQ
jgi:surface-anchored protein